jgi:integrase
MGRASGRQPPVAHRLPGALALRWEDVNLDTGILQVSHTLDPRTHEIGAMKTELSRRTIHLPALGLAALREQRRQQLDDRLRAGRKWQGLGYTFASRVGTPLDTRNVDRRYHAAREAFDLPSVPWHHPRRFAATALLEAGEELFVVSRILGHANIATTASFCSHVHPSMLRTLGGRMDDLMRKASGT